MKHLVTIVFLLLITNTFMFAQSKTQYVPGNKSFQFGFTIKGSVEFGFGKNSKRPNPVFRLAADAGLGSTFLAQWLLPTINQEFQLYSGGFGSRNRLPELKPRFTFDVITAFTLTAGGDNYFTSPNSAFLADRDVPLYYFANFARPALQNPYRNSASLGFNSIFSSDPKRKHQWVGFFNGHLFDRTQFAYYNDGGFGFNTILTPHQDRYFTGGGFISYSGKKHTAFNLIEIGYSKFTGDADKGFNLAYNLGMAYVDYKDPEQQMFNKGIVNINVANPYKGYGLELRFNNFISLDAQNVLHYSQDNPYHLVPYSPYISVIASGYSSYNKTGLR